MSAARARPFSYRPILFPKKGRRPAKRIIGIDLSGTANASDTAAAVFAVPDKCLDFISLFILSTMPAEGNPPIHGQRVDAPFHPLYSAGPNAV